MPAKSYGIESNASLFDTNSTSSTNSGSKGNPLELPSDAPNASPGILDTLGRVLVALSLVVVLIVVTVWGLKLIWEKRGISQQTDEGKSIRVLSSVFLAPRKAVYLVEVGKRILVIGAGNEEMHALDVIIDPVEVDALKKSSVQGFPVLLDKILKRADAKEPVSNTAEILSDSKKTIGGYIKRLKESSPKNKRAIDERDGKPQ